MIHIKIVQDKVSFFAGFAFPNLESLVLAECPIQSLAISDDEGEESCNKNYEKAETVQETATRPESPHDAFKSLKVLNLNSTNLSSWDDIERLAQFPALQCVRILVRIRIIDNV